MKQKVVVAFWKFMQMKVYNRCSISGNWPNLSGRFVIQPKLIMKTFCCMQMITKCNNSFFLTERMWGKWVTLGQAYSTRPMYFNDFLRDFISAFYCSFWQQIRCPSIHSVTSLFLMSTVFIMLSKGMSTEWKIPITYNLHRVNYMYCENISLFFVSFSACTRHSV